MNTKRKFKRYLGLLIIITTLFLIGCGPTDQAAQDKVEEKDPAIEETKSEELEETDSEETETEEEKVDQEEANLDGELAMIDGNPIGDYKASGVTKYMIIKTDPLTQNNRPGGFLEEDIHI